MTIKFNAKTAASIKPIPGKRMEYFDAARPGLCLRVTGTGAKSWCVLYRHRGKLRRLTLGDTDVLSLADARERARDALHEASKGADPAAEKKQARQAETIADLATQYIDQHAKRKKRSWREDDRILRNYVLPAWKHKAIADVKRKDVRALVEGIADRAPVMANRVLACTRKMLSFAVGRELIEANPAARFTKPGAEQSRDRVLTADEIRAFWQATGKLEPAMRAFFRLRLVTAQRGKEVAALRAADIADDWWTIPAEMSKNKLPHRVPLSPLALDILRTVQTSGQNVHKSDGYLLAGARGRRQRTEAAATLGLDDFRGHDLRRTAASLMASGGVARLTISKILNHVETGVTAIYDRHSYDGEKRTALDWWSAKLSAILDGKGGNVLPFAKWA
jgi:integrase